MDPLSILGAASASSALLRLITGAVKDLIDLQNKLQQTDRAVQLLVEELSSLGVALTQIQSWAERVRADGHTREGVVCGLNNTLKGCKAAMDDLARSISPLEKDVSLSGGGIRAKRIKYVWKEADIKDHQARLQSLKISLILSLFAAQWSVFLLHQAKPFLSDQTQ
jgi:Fungal N-terminal domain of STAND proteins